MNKFTLAALAALAFAGTASAQVRWNPEGAWATDNGKTILPVAEDGKTVINKLKKLDNGNWRADIRYAATANFIEEEPYAVFQITTEGCAWNPGDFKFEFMIQRRVSDGLTEEGKVKWGATTTSTDEEYPSFNGDKYKVVDQYHAELFQLLGSRIGDGTNDDLYSEDIIVIDLNEVKGLDADKTPGLLFNAGAVNFPNYNDWTDIVPADENGLGGVQQRSWFGFVCIAKPESVTVADPAFHIHYTGTAEDSSDALTLCEDYANGDGGQEVRDDDPYSAVDTVVEESVKVYLKDGRTVVAPGADSVKAYTVDGKFIGSGVDTLQLENGLYIVKAEKNGATATVKALVR